MFFMPYLKDEATKLNVRGFARELEDKRIEVFIEGDLSAVEAMIPQLAGRDIKIRKYVSRFGEDPTQGYFEEII
jgi:acylphosphatase